MPPPPVEQLRVVKYAHGWGYAAAEWARALAEIDWTRSHADGGPERLKLRRSPDGPLDPTVWCARLALGRGRHEIVLKTDVLGSFRKRAQAWLGQTKAFRQWRGAAELERAGFRVARARAILRGRLADGRVAEVLALESLPGRTLLEVLARGGLGARAEHRLAAEVGAWTRGLWAAGLANADHKPSNIVVLPGDAGLALVDTTDIDRPGHRGAVLGPGGFDRHERWVEIGMLAALAIEPMGVGAGVRRGVAMRAVLAAVDGDRTASRDLWRGVAAHIAAHGDPTPEDDPLKRA